jgi:hypothetical protein
MFQSDEREMKSSDLQSEVSRLASSHQPPSPQPSPMGWEREKTDFESSSLSSSIRFIDGDPIRKADGAPPWMPLSVTEFSLPTSDFDYGH